MDIHENRQPINTANHRPSAKNPFTDIRFFVFCGFMFNINVTWATVMFMAIMTTVEVRYQLPTTQLASLATVGLVGSLITLPFVTYFCGRPTDQRPRWIAAGGMLIALGFMITAIPHFLTDPYTYDEVENNTRTGAVLKGLCMNDDEDHLVWNATQCDEEGQKVTAESQLAYIFFMIGKFLAGVGYAPTQTLMLSYIDDNAGDNSPLFIGIYEASWGVGPPLGFFLAGVFLRYYVDFYRVDMATIDIAMNDPRWVGAWWLAIVFGVTGILLFAVPMFFFPKAMKVPASTRVKRTGPSLKRASDVQPSGLLNTLKDYVRVYGRLLGNGVLVLALFGYTIDRPVGFAFFLPKFFQRMALLDPSVANVVLGVTWLLPVALASIISGYIIKKFKLTLIGIIKMILVLSVIAVTCSWLLLAFPCEGIEFSNPQHGAVAVRNDDLSASCNADCGCSNEHFQPLCGSDGRNYFSPCYAGCSSLPLDKNFTECACILTNNNTTTDGVAQYASDGLCPKDACQGNLIPFIIVLVIFALANHGGMVPNINITMRLVDEKDKSVALGLRFIFGRLFSYLPGTIITGRLIDSTCAIWQTKCGNSGACAAFNSEKFRYMFVGITAGATTVALFFYIALYVLVKRKETRKAATERYSKVSRDVERIAFHNDDTQYVVQK